MENRFDFLSPEGVGLLSSLSALLISIVALGYTVKAYLLKAGHRLRCDIGTCSSVECNDHYVSSITLENIKDRATVIFKIYLRLGRNYYLLLEDFSNSPLILRPFEVYHKEYEPILFYSDNSRVINLDSVLYHKKRKVILSTTDGKYVVNANTKRWDIIPKFFKNLMTAIIDPIRTGYKGKKYGANVKFLVVLKDDENKETVIPLHERDYRLKVFVNFRLTEECLNSVENLKIFLKKQKKLGKLTYKDMKIIDFQKHYNEIRSEYEKDILNAKYISFFKYEILGRLGTILEDRRLKKVNRDANQKRIAEMKKDI